MAWLARPACFAVKMITEKIFESALGIRSPWFIAGMNIGPSQRQMRIHVDFEVGSRFAVPGHSGEHPVHDTVTKTYRHLNFFQHECELQVRVPRVKLTGGKVVQVSPPWAGKLSGFTLLFEAFVLLLCREMLFAAVARITGVSVASGDGLGRSQKYRLTQAILQSVYHSSELEQHDLRAASAVIQDRSPHTLRVAPSAPTKSRKRLDYVPYVVQHDYLMEGSFWLSRKNCTPSSIDQSRELSQ